MAALPFALPRVIVVHPGRQHSHQTALALFQAGMLEAYWAGVPCGSAYIHWLPSRIRNKAANYANVPLPENVVTWNPVAPLLRWMGNRLLGRKHGACLEYAGYAIFDSWAARRLRRQSADAVICYENSALRTFSIAKSKGILIILDAASIHHKTQDRVSRITEPQRLHEWICRAKDKEIALADYILTVSTLARQTYIDAGIPPAKLLIIPMGADLTIFSAPMNDKKYATSRGFRFIFVGHINHRKGFDLLARAFARVRNTAPNTELLVAGAYGDASDWLDKTPGVKYLGKLSQMELAEFYRSSDCFVLPSRHDSYGMVVAEALACGVPVIVSDMVGAKDWVIPGSNGWVVPVNDVGELERQMKWCVENRAGVMGMRAQAQESAFNMGWSAYYQRLAETIDRIASRTQCNVRPQRS